MVQEKLGKLLVSARLINEEQLQKAIFTQKKEGGRLGSILVKLGFMEENKLLTFLSQQYKLPFVDPARLEIDPAVIKLVPSELVQKHHVIPIK
ncbi:MAG: type II secretion system protein GspE, partial [Nitrospiria bacterium]